MFDLVFSRDESDINVIHYCSPLGKSDHVLLKIITSISVSTNADSYSQRYDWNKGNYDEFRKLILDTDWSLLKDMDVNDMWIYIKSILHDGINLFIPSIKINDKRKDKPPWMNPTIRKSIKKKSTNYSNDFLILVTG